ncbi:hypothetical protein GVAV_003424 [Gurleya vavrai]
MLFLIKLTAASFFKIRLSDTEDYVSGELDVENPLHLVDSAAANIYVIEFKDFLGRNVNIRLSQNKSRGWEFNSNGSFVQTIIKNEMKNVFQLVPLELEVKNYWITHEKRCMTWDMTHLQFNLQECKENNKNQRFELDEFDEEEIMRFGSSINNKMHKQTRKELLLEKVRDSHMLENEAEILLANVYNMISKVNFCLLKNGVCEVADSFIDKIYENSYFKTGNAYTNNSAVFDQAYCYN